MFHIFYDIITVGYESEILHKQIGKDYWLTDQCTNMSSQTNTIMISNMAYAFRMLLGMTGIFKCIHESLDNCQNISGVALKRIEFFLSESYINVTMRKTTKLMLF